MRAGRQEVEELGVVDKDKEVVFGSEKEEQRLCKESFDDIGLSVECCPEGGEKEITLPSWLEILGDDAPKNRLLSVGVVIHTSQDEKERMQIVEEDSPFTSRFIVENILFTSHSIDVLYRIGPGNDSKLQLQKAFRQINKELGPWVNQSQLLLWPNYIDREGLTLNDVEGFGRVFAFGDADSFEWGSGFTKKLEPGKKLPVYEDDFSTLAEIKKEGSGSSAVLIRSTILDLSYPNIKDLSKRLKGLNNLTSLNLTGTQESDISVLKDLKNLSSLYLSSTQESDISVLKDLKNLSYLDLSSTQVSDFSVLKDLKNLSYLDLSSTQVSNISVLKDLKNLS
ncbi:leucine-rich repeat domain-containing protein, partial [Desulfobacterales bacterium HSG16]|nr:leucine-rich repeat domain-containing protein [Desulfobacterales bacterium HSG16]